MFYDEVLKEIGALNGFCIVNRNGEAVYVEGIKRVLNLDESEVRLACKRAVVTVSGIGLSVRTLDEGSAVIAGDVTSVTTEKR